jgi:MFS family permease
MMLGVVASSMTGGFIVRKFAYRNIMLVSALVLTAGLALLGFAMDTSTSRGMITLYMIVVGLGMGVSFSVLNMSTLTNIPPQYKGSATSLVAFFRTIGSALGVTVFGAMQKHDFLSEAGALVGGNAKMLAQIRSGQALLDPKMQAALGIPANVLQKLLDALADSIIYVFQWAVVLPVVALVFAMLMGRARLAPVPRPGGNGGPNKESEPSFHAG